MSVIRSRMRPVALALSALVVAAVVACDGGDDATPTATPTPSPTPTPTATATSPAAITDAHEIDFTDLDLIGELIDAFGGGEVDTQRIQYVDLTRDGIDDAFVIVESGGTGGDVGGALLTVEDGEPKIVGQVRTGGRVEVRFPEVGGGVVVTTEGVWEPGDAECCPSNLRESTYEWVDGAFVLKNEQVVDNPDVEGQRD